MSLNQRMSKEDAEHLHIEILLTCFKNIMKFEGKCMELEKIHPE